MAIDYAKLRSLSARQLINALLREGFLFDRSSGSHHHYRHPDGRHVTVSFHRPGQTFTPKTLKSMIETQARWADADLRRLGLMN